MMSQGGGSSAEHDVYVTQLQEVFDSCDTQKTGRLSKTELHSLCTKLQVDEQSEALIHKLLKDNPQNTVGFEEFKEGFVAVLSESVEGLDATSSDEEDNEEESEAHDEQSDADQNEITPKFIKGAKRYGRRSLPSHHSGLDLGRNQTSSPGNNTNAHDRRDKGANRDLATDIGDTPDTYEAEGQLNRSIGEMETTLDPVSEEQHLRAIWRELGVGQGDSLSMSELGTVCEHIGMDEMNDEELRHLFVKLDVDKDGRVSFHEFLHGLFQHGGPATPSSTPVRPPSTPRLKLRMSVVDYENRPQTPSFITSLSGLFSTLDPEGTGYASVEAIVDLWDNLGVTNGLEILEYLQFDTRTKVALSELSLALEQEMRSVEEDNATYQVAVVSYQHELKHLKSANDMCEAERDKLKQDLVEANQRTLLLIKEGDERQVATDANWENQLMSVQTKYQEQIRLLQAEIDGETEALTLQSARQHSQLEGEVLRLKEEEARLREKLMLTQRELERLEQDILEMAEKYAEMEKVNSRQQRELEEAATIQLRLEEMESSQAQMVDEQSKWTTARMEQLESNSNELKDKNDELTMEVEELRQQLATSRRRTRTSHGRDHSVPHRNGSVLSDYQKPFMIVRRSSDTVSSEDDEGSTAGGSARGRRTLPRPPELTSSSEEPVKALLRADVEGLQKEKHNLQAQVDAIRKDKEELLKEKSQKEEVEHTEKVKQLMHSFSLERKDIEQAYKLEITDIEDQHLHDKELLLAQHEKEKVLLIEQMEKDFQERLAAKQAVAEHRLEEEKRDVLIRVESEKNVLKQQLVEQELKLRESLSKEYEAKVSKKMADLEKKHAVNLQATASLDTTKSASLQTRIAELELQVKLEKEELELSFQKERLAMQEKMDEDRSSLHHRYRQEIADLENSLSLGEGALRGKLREDFNNLVEQHRVVVAREERQRASELCQQQSKDLERHLQEEKLKLKQQHDSEVENQGRTRQAALKDMEKRHHTALAEREQCHMKELGDLQEKHDRFVLKLKEESRREREDLRLKHEGEQAVVEEQLARTCEDLLTAQACLEEERELRRRAEREVVTAKEDEERERSVAKDAWEETARQQKKMDNSRDRLSAEIQEQLEEDFQQQIEHLKQAYGEERSALEAHISLLQKELDEQSSDQHGKYSLEETVLKEELQNLRRLNDDLHQGKQQTDVRLENLSQHYTKLLQEKDTSIQHLEQRVQKLVKENDEVSALWRNALPGRASVSVSASQGEFEKEREGAILTALARQQAFLETTTGDIRHELHNLSKTTGETAAVQEKLPRMQEDLIRELEITAARVVELETTVTLMQSSHQRELQRVEASLEGMVPVARLQESTDALGQAQTRISELERRLEERAAETRKRLKGSEEDHQEAINKLEDECHQLQQQLHNKQLLLDEQLEKLHGQYDTSIRRDVLVKDLYVENANIIKTLYETEKREKDLRSDALTLQDRCYALEALLERVTHAALS